MYCLIFKEDSITVKRKLMKCVIALGVSSIITCSVTSPILAEMTYDNVRASTEKISVVSDLTSEPVTEEMIIPKTKREIKKIANSDVFLEKQQH